MIVKKIIGFENYTINEFGEVRNKKGCIRKPFVDSKGRYLMIDLSKANKRYRFLLHRLVAFNFIENPNNYPVINHKDDTTKNNHYSNLEWCTIRYNVHQEYKHTPPTRNFVPCCVKKDGKIIGSFANKTEACKIISEKYGVSRMSLIRHGRSNGYEIIVECND